MSYKCGHQACKEVFCEDHILHADLWYPGSSDFEIDEKTPTIKTIQIGLFDVRAAADIRVEFNYKENAWKIFKSVKETWIEAASIDASFPIEKVR